MWSHRVQSLNCSYRQLTMTACFTRNRLADKGNPSHQTRMARYFSTYSTDSYFIGATFYVCNGRPWYPACPCKDTSTAASCGPCRRALLLPRCCASRQVSSYPLSARAKTSHPSAGRLERPSPSAADYGQRSNE